MDIKYLGHSSFKLSSKSISVITDPFDNSIGIKFPSESATIVTVSHQHSDHNNSDAVKDVKKIVSGPGEYEIEGVSIIGLASYHDDKKGEERGTNTIYVYEMEELRLAHLGDIGHKLSEKQVEELGDIDILMLPVGGTYTIDAKTAVEVVQSIEPEIIIPMHYNSPELDQKTFGELTDVDRFTKELGVKVVEEKKYSVKSTDMTDEDQTVVVLTRS